MTSVAKTLAHFCHATHSSLLTPGDPHFLEERPSCSGVDAAKREEEVRQRQKKKKKRRALLFRHNPVCPAQLVSCRELECRAAFFPAEVLLSH